MVTPHGRFFSLELKAKNNTLTTEQRAFAGDVLAAGGDWEWADSLDLALAALERRGILRPNKADVEGQNDVASLFRSTAEGETGHAHGHLDYLAQVGDPATDLPIGSSRQNLKAAVAGETHEYTDMYPGMAKSARDEGFDEISDWFETLAKAERSHANRFQKALDALTD